ncbi:hypothetical protein [Hymenobacter sp. CRA2]|uniref:hypothetical protein n=1 Tax=Hymenobacter sp. CRA2 TaxID=1955620 RepID=UPI00098FB613|nr:hypothetical protein [Hymenobacter sp. CRA2]OON70045.1 hypothetical protein B0919_04675 [Hymenobacter sp. CRA2]
MKQLLKFFTLAAALAVGSASSAVPLSGTRSEVSMRRSYIDYQEGYANGKRETEQNKCIDGDLFVERYWYYRGHIESSFNYPMTDEQRDYWNGYLDGMAEGYNTPVYCSGPGGGGTGGGGTGGGGGTDNPDLGG